MGRGLERGIFVVADIARLAPSEIIAEMPR